MVVVVVVVVAMVVVALVDMTNIVGGGELDTGTTREDPLSLTHAMAEDKVVSVLALAMAEEVVVAVTPVAMAEDEVVSVLALAMAEEVVVAVTPVAMAEDEVALVMADELCATCSLDCFLAAALVCQPQEHGCSFRLSEEKNDPFWRACWHFLMAAMAASTSLLEGFWPLPVKAGRPSARSMSFSAYCPIPRK